MNSHVRCLSLAVILAIAWLIATPTVNFSETKSSSANNKQLIRDSFDRWRAGTGGPFELLASDATWTIAGNSVVAKKYVTRDEFLDTVIKPFNARLRKPLLPTVRSLLSDGDTVIALFDGEATARDGRPYRNSYAWFMEMRDGKIVNVTAFFDSIAFNDFWKRNSASD